MASAGVAKRLQLLYSLSGPSLRTSASLSRRETLPVTATHPQKAKCCVFQTPTPHNPANQEKVNCTEKGETSSRIKSCGHFTQGLTLTHLTLEDNVESGISTNSRLGCKPFEYSAPFGCLGLSSRTSATLAQKSYSSDQTFQTKRSQRVGGMGRRPLK